jgi:hypothetical protein
MKTRYPNHYKLLRVSSVWERKSFLFSQHERVMRAEATGVEPPEAPVEEDSAE